MEERRGKTKVTLEELQQELEITQASRAAWVQQLEEANALMQRAQVHALQATRQLDLHDGDMRRLEWMIARMSESSPPLDPSESVAAEGESV